MNWYDYVNLHLIDQGIKQVGFVCSKVSESMSQWERRSESSTSCIASCGFKPRDFIVKPSRECSPTWGMTCASFLPPLNWQCGVH